MTHRRGHETGEIAPALMLVMFALVAAGTWFLDHAGAASLTAQGDTAADAAALAGADSLRAEGGPGLGAIASMLATGELPPGAEAAAMAAASDYADRNGGELLDGDMELRQGDSIGGEHAVRFIATVRTDRELEGEYPTRTAAAELRFSLTAPGTGNCMSQAAVDALIAEAGVGDTHNGVSGLGGDACRSSMDTENLEHDFKLAIIRSEAAMKERGAPDDHVLLYSAFRSVVEQAELHAAYLACLAGPNPAGCGPAAPPGASQHNYGRAIDVENWQELRAVVDTIPDICWPDIPNDSVHFQNTCPGILGGLPGGLALGRLEFDDVHLVRVDS